LGSLGLAILLAFVVYRIVQKRRADGAGRKDYIDDDAGDLLPPSEAPSEA